MRTDTYTKVVLTVIAVCLFAISCKQYVSPSTTAHAAGQVLPLQISQSSSGTPYIFNPNTGLIYWFSQDGKVFREWSVNAFGGSFDGNLTNVR